MARKVNRRLRELSEQQPSERGARYIPGEEDEGPILSRIGFLMASVLVFVLVTAAAAWFGAHQIEDSLEAAATVELSEAGFGDIAVVADGRSLQVAGTVDRETDIEGITAAVDRVPGVTDMAVAINVETVEVEEGPVAADPLMLAWSGEELEVTGSMSTEQVRRRVVRRLETAYPAGVDHEGLTVREGVSPEGPWLPGVLDVVDSLARSADDGEVVVNGDAGVITISAELPDRQTRADIRVDAEEVLAAGPLDFVSGLTVEDAPPPPAPEEVEELQEDLDDLIEGKVVEFALNSTRLTNRGTALLDEVLEALRLFPDVPVEIAGHADAQGDDQSNLVLSRRRAEAVLAYLVEHGENEDRFQVVGYGETRPIADNATPEGRARNRRIEFVALTD